MSSRPKNFLDVCKDTILPSICSRIPNRVFTALTATNPLCAYYHIVSDEEVPHVRHLYPYRSIKEFTNDLDVFCQRFRIISLHELLEHVRSDRPLPQNALLLTFDDGFSESIDVIAPILQKKGAPATFFIISDCLDNKGMAHHNRASLLLERLSRVKSSAIEKRILDVLSTSDDGDRDRIASLMVAIDYRRRDLVDEIAKLLDYDIDAYLATRKPYLTSDQVNELIAQGFAIGGHSIDHPQYSLLSLQEQVRQTLHSVDLVRTKFALEYGAFAFPHGDDRVTDQFFNLTQAGRVDVSFGTAGIAKDLRPRHFQRFSTENSAMPAAQVLGRYYARSVFKMLTGEKVSSRD